MKAHQRPHPRGKYHFTSILGLGSLLLLTIAAPQPLFAQSNSETIEFTFLSTPIHAPHSDSFYAYKYDPNGNLIEKRNLSTNHRTQYQYDARNKPVLIRNNGTPIAGYLYDLNGIRIAKTSGQSADIQESYFGALEKIAANGSVRKYFMLGGKRIARRNENGELEFIHQDHLGSASVMTHPALGHQVVAERKFYEFGAVESEIRETSEESHSFHDKRLNVADDSYDFSARQYMARHFRFSTPDTIVPNPSRPQSFNRYAYVSNNPLSRVDPSGHSDYLLNGTSNWLSTPSDWNAVRKDAATNRFIESGCFFVNTCPGSGSDVGGFVHSPNYDPMNFHEPGLHASMPLLDNPVSAILGEVAAEIGAFAGNAASKAGGKYFGSAVSFLVVSLFPDGTPGPPRPKAKAKGNRKYEAPRVIKTVSAANPLAHEVIESLTSQSRLNLFAGMVLKGRKMGLPSGLLASTITQHGDDVIGEADNFRLVGEIGRAISQGRGCCRHTNVLQTLIEAINHGKSGDRFGLLVGEVPGDLHTIGYHATKDLVLDVSATGNWKPFATQGKLFYDQTVGLSKADGESIPFTLLQGFPFFDVE